MSCWYSPSINRLRISAIISGVNLARDRRRPSIAIIISPLMARSEIDERLPSVHIARIGFLPLRVSEPVSAKRFPIGKLGGTNTGLSSFRAVRITNSRSHGGGKRLPDSLYRSTDFNGGCNDQLQLRDSRIFNTLANWKWPRFVLKKCFDNVVEVQLCASRSPKSSVPKPQAASRIGAVLNPSDIYARSQLHREKPQPCYYPSRGSARNSSQNKCSLRERETLISSRQRMPISPSLLAGAS